MNLNDNMILVPPSVLKELIKKFPNLSPTELKVSALISMNLSSKVIAEITNRNIRTIEYTRYNIRKKTKCKPGAKLTHHILASIHDIKNG